MNNNGDEPDLQPSVQAPELDVHDDTIQALYGIGLKLEYCMALVDESPEQAKAALDAAIGSLTDVIVTLRRRMYDLREISRVFD